MTDMMIYQALFITVCIKFSLFALKKKHLGFLSLGIGLNDVLDGVLLVHLVQGDTGDLGDSDEGEEEVDSGEPLM